MRRLFFAVMLLCLFAGLALATQKFELKDVLLKYNPAADMTKIIGDITNNSDKAYERTAFRLSFYDKENKLIGMADFFIKDFKVGETATFETVADGDMQIMSTYKIRLNSSN